MVLQAAALAHQPHRRGRCKRADALAAVRQHHHCLLPAGAPACSDTAAALLHHDPALTPLPLAVSTVIHLISACSYGAEGEAREAQIKKLLSKMNYVVEHQLKDGKKFLVGDGFTIADSYFAIVLSWASYVSVELPAPLVEYRDHIFGLDFVKEARAAMAAASPK